MPQSLLQADAELGSRRRLRTLRFVSSMGLDRSFTSTCLLSAKEVADLTNPSISAPLKFFVRSAAQTSSCQVSGTKLVCRQSRGVATASSRRAAHVHLCCHAKGRKAAQHGLQSPVCRAHARLLRATGEAAEKVKAL